MRVARSAAPGPGGAGPVRRDTAKRREAHQRRGAARAGADAPGPGPGTTDQARAARVRTLAGAPLRRRRRAALARRVPRMEHHTIREPIVGSRLRPARPARNRRGHCRVAPSARSACPEPAGALSGFAFGTPDPPGAGEGIVGLRLRHARPARNRRGTLSGRAFGMPDLPGTGEPIVGLRLRHARPARNRRGHCRVAPSACPTCPEPASPLSGCAFGTPDPPGTGEGMSRKAAGSATMMAPRRV